MKKQVLLFSILAVFLCGALMVATGNVAASGRKKTEYCRVSLEDPKSNLNVRTFEGEVIGKLKHGTRVWVNEYSGEWARVSVKKGRRWSPVGWVDSNYLECN